MPDDDAQIGSRVIEELKRCLWRLQFVPTNVECTATITTGVMDDGTELQIIIRGVKHEG